MTPEELQVELASGTLRPAYLVAGEETVLRDDAVAAIRSAVLSDGPADFNLSRFDGDRATPAELEVAVATLPVMAAHRLVLVREPEERRGAARGLTEAIEVAVVWIISALSVGGTAGSLKMSRNLASRRVWQFEKSTFLRQSAATPCSVIRSKSGSERLAPTAR